MIQALILLAYVLAAHGAGSFLLQRIKFRSLLEHAVFSQAAGLALFSFATMILGLLGLLHTPLFAAGLAAILALFHRRIAVLVKQILQSRTKVSIRLDTMLAGILAAMMLLNIIAGLAPVHASDAVIYHVATPKLFAEQHRLYDIPSNPTSQYPQGVDMLFLNGYLLSGGKLSQLIAMHFGILLALAVYSLTTRYFSKRTGLIAALLVYSAPVFSVFNIRGFVDIPTAFYGLLAVHALMMWQEEQALRLVALSAAMAGFAAAIKTSALPIPPTIGLLFAVSLLTRRKVRELLRAAMLFGTIGGALALPWLIRSIIQTGNPVYPLYYNHLGGEYLNPVLSECWTAILDNRYGTGLAALAAMPWNVTMHTFEFGELLGPGSVFLAVLPTLLLMKKVDSKVKYLLIIGGIFLVQWFYTAQVIRYLFLIMALFAIASGYALSRIIKESKFIGLAAMALFLATNLALWIGTNADELKVVAGFESEDDFLQRKLTNHGLLEHANTMQGAQLCLYGEIRGYYSSNPYHWCHPAFQGYVDFSKISTGMELENRMVETDMTHIVVENSMQEWREFYERKNISSCLTLLDNGDKAVGEFVQGRQPVFENDMGAIYYINQSRR